MKKNKKRYYKRVFYLTQSKQCPVPVSVRLPTGSCQGGCWFCCSASWKGKSRMALKHTLTDQEFLEVWTNAFSGNWRGIWLQDQVRLAVEGRGWLRFVREDLFEPSIPDITKTILQGCKKKDVGILVKTSRIAIFQWFEYLKTVRHHIVFCITPLLSDWREKIKILNFLCLEGLNVVLGLAPINEFTFEVKEILENISDRVKGVWVGWLHGKASWFRPGMLKPYPYKEILRESQYKKEYLQEIVKKIQEITEKRGIPLNFYFTSAFWKGGSCCHF